MTNIFKTRHAGFRDKATDAIAALQPTPVPAMRKPPRRNAILLKYGSLIGPGDAYASVFLSRSGACSIICRGHIEFDLRNDFYEHLQRLPFEFYQTHPPAI